MESLSPVTEQIGTGELFESANHIAEFDVESGLKRSRSVEASQSELSLG